MKKENTWSFRSNIDKINLGRILEESPKNALLILVELNHFKGKKSSVLLATPLFLKRADKVGFRFPFWYPMMDKYGSFSSGPSSEPKLIMVEYSNCDEDLSVKAKEMIKTLREMEKFKTNVVVTVFSE